jgi:hypothetical protein
MSLQTFQSKYEYASGTLTCFTQPEYLMYALGLKALECFRESMLDQHADVHRMWRDNACDK